MRAEIVIFYCERQHFTVLQSSHVASLGFARAQSGFDELRDLLCSETSNFITTFSNTSSVLLPNSPLRAARSRCFRTVGILSGFSPILRIRSSRSAFSWL